MTSPRLVILNVVGLSQSLIGENTPGIAAFAAAHGQQSYQPAFPAVTCTAQSDLLTGKTAADHGIVANGWYDRESAEVRFWKQSNHLVHGEKIWETLKKHDPSYTCAKWFWWYNMHSSADFSATPRPLYPADGRKVFDIHTQPMGLREEMKNTLGEFPFPAFWGPRAGIESSRWIADSARWIEKQESPNLSLVYLPHLDYPLQKLGPTHPDIPSHLRAIDEIVSELIQFYQSREVRVIILSEYGITPVNQPVHLNRLFRQRGWLSIKNELGRETLDCGGSKVFAVADHQVAHVYLSDPALQQEVTQLLENTPGVARVTPRDALYPAGIGYERAGDLIVEAAPEAWFTYYYWENDQQAPDFARTIDIHRKPGFDPCELFVDPNLAFPKLKIGAFLLKKKLGLRGLLEVIPLDATLVKGSHGRRDVPESHRPVVIGTDAKIKDATEVHTALLAAAGLPQVTD